MSDIGTQTLTFTKSGPPLFECDLQSLEADLGASLPSFYRQLLLKHNGGRPHPGVFAFQMDQINNEQEIDYVLGLGLEYEDVRNYRFRIYADRVPDELLPIISALESELVCLGLKGEHRGKIYYWNHDWEAEEDDDGPHWENIYFLANSLEEFIAAFYGPDQPQGTAINANIRTLPGDNRTNVAAQWRLLFEETFRPQASPWTAEMSTEDRLELVLDLQDDIGLRLPKDYKEFLLYWGGLDLEDPGLEFVIPDGGSGARSIRTLKTLFGFSDGLYNPDDLRSIASSVGAAGDVISLLPIGRDDQDGLLLIGLAKEILGKVFASEGPCAIGMDGPPPFDSLREIGISFATFVQLLGDRNGSDYKATYQEIFKGNVVQMDAELFVRPDEELARELEEWIGGPLPRDYRAFFLEYAGMSVVPDRGVMTYPIKASRRPEDVGEIDRFFGFRTNPVDPDDIRRRLVEREGGRIRKGLLPIGQNHDGDILCLELDGERAGEIFLWERAPIHTARAGIPYQNHNVFFVAHDFLEFAKSLRVVSN